MTDKYDYILEADEEGSVELPEKFQNKEVVLRQQGVTIVHRQESLQMYATSQNDHLEKNEDYFEAEWNIIGQEEKHLAKIKLQQRKKAETEVEN